MDNSKEFQLMLDKAMESESLALESFDRTKNVQDQLQEMLGRIVPDIHLRKCLIGWYMTWECGGQYQTYGSLEQLWLAFVMKECFGKVWHGEKWIKLK